VSDGREEAWRQLHGLSAQTLAELFAADPRRVAKLSQRFELDDGGMLFDWSKTHLTDDVLSGFEALAQAAGLAEARRKLFAGEVVNPSEGRAAEHTTLRGVGNPARVEEAAALHERMRTAETRAVFAYDERLRLLPSYLQQLEMESNGKSVTADGRPVEGPTAPIVWGGVGTDQQHAVFQLLHQGTHLVPVEFIACIAAGDDLDPRHHQVLLQNCFAQGAALMSGKTSGDPARSYPGDRPSATILLDALDPAAFGALVAFHEHRTFANAVLLGINPFDQFGVELGKDIARSIDRGGGHFDPGTTALLAAAGLD
jgi:glucose-6-phosphate isomerase